MNPFRLRILAQLMRGTRTQIETLLMVPDPERPQFGFVSYSGAYNLIRRHAENPSRALAALVGWRDQTNISARTRTFRENVFPHLEWCVQSVLPRIERVVEHLDGDRQNTGQLLEIDGQAYSGGFHALVLWEDGSQRLMYFLGPRWSRRRIQHMLVLLQIKAMQVYESFPQSVVVVDLSRHEIIELADFDPDDREEAYRTAARLSEYMQRRRAA